MEIEQERQLVAHAKSNKRELKGNEARLQSLEDGRKRYAERIRILETTLGNTVDANPASPEDIEELLQKLYQLPHWGKNLKVLRDMGEWPKASGFRAHRVRTRARTATRSTNFWSQSLFAVKGAAASLGNFHTGPRRSNSSVGNNNSRVAGIRRPATLVNNNARAGGYGLRSKR